MKRPTVESLTRYADIRLVRFGLADALEVLLTDDQRGIVLAGCGAPVECRSFEGIDRAVLTLAPRIAGNASRGSTGRC